MWFNRQNLGSLISIGLTVLLSMGSVYADKGSSTVQPPDSSWYQRMEQVNVPNIGLREFLQGVAIQNNLNIIIDQDIQTKVSLHLQDVSVWDLIQYLAEEHNLDLAWKHNFLSISAAITQRVSKKQNYTTLNIGLSESLLSLECVDVPANLLIDSLVARTGLNILIEPTLNVKIQGRLSDLPINEAIQTLLQHNGLAVKDRDGVMFVSRSRLASSGNKQGYKQQSVIVNSDNSISLDLQDAKIGDVLQEITDQSSIPIITYLDIPGTVTVKTEKLDLNTTLSLLLRNTNATYRREGKIFFIGDKKMAGMTTRQLVRLKHIKSSGVAEVLPRSITNNLEIKEIKEMNSLMLIGTRDIIDEATSFIDEIDETTPQILIEALVVDIHETNISEFDLDMGIDTTARAGLLATLFPFIEGTTNKAGVGAIADALGVGGTLSKTIGKLPADFYVHLKALEQKGIVSIESKPHIATLNGHKASLIISTTQYYIFESNVTIPTAGSPTTQTSQRFEKITAEIKLEITPWVSADNEITVEIHPEFSTPVGSFNPDVPPTINSRILDSTVRLRDGETIVLGGMIQTTQNENNSMFPVLGNLPWIGKLFRSHTKNEGKSELVIYLTPHLINK